MLDILANLPHAKDDGRALLAALRKAAKCALCVRYHQDQAEGVAQQWFQALIREQEHGVDDDGEQCEQSDELDEEIRRHEEAAERLRRRKQQQKQSGEAKMGQQEDARRRRDEARMKEEEARRRREAEDERQQARERRQQEEQHRQEEERREQRQREGKRRQEARRQVEREREKQRQQREQATRERINREWAESWTRYERDWEKMKRVDTTSLNEDVRESVPWPVKTGKWQDVNETNVRVFLRQGPGDVAGNAKKFRSMLRRQALRWHEDKLKQFFPRIAGDAEALVLANTVMVVINGLTANLSS